MKPVEEVRSLIQSARASGEDVISAVPSVPGAVPAFRELYLAWESRTQLLLESCFKTEGIFTSSPASEFTGTAVGLLDLKIASTAIPLDRVSEVEGDVREKLRVLRSLEGRLEFFQRMYPVPAPDRSDGPIFLVHGRDGEKRETVRRYLENVTDREVIVLADEPGKGQDVLGKLLASAERASFAVVLLTPDDEGCLKNETPQPRARQNVVFELGLFIGLLGRSKVATIYDPKVELPTDFLGVAYISAEDQWQIALARELRSAGVEVDLNPTI